MRSDMNKPTNDSNTPGAAGADQLSSRTGVPTRGATALQSGADADEPHPASATSMPRATGISRRTIMNIALKSALIGASSVTLVSTNALAITDRRIEPDPIFAAIEQHRKANTAFAGAAVAQDRAELEADRNDRSWFEDAEVIAATTRSDEAALDEDTAALDLISIHPTTPAGVLALLRYSIEADPDDCTWSGKFEDARGRDRAWHHLLVINLTKILPEMLREPNGS